MWRLFQNRAPRSAAAGSDGSSSVESGKAKEEVCVGASNGSSGSSKIVTGHERVRATQKGGRAAALPPAGATANDDSGSASSGSGNDEEPFELVGLDAAAAPAPEPLAPPPSPLAPPRETRTVGATLRGRATARVELEARNCAADARVLYALLADPRRHARIFDAIESSTASLLSSVGPVSTYALDYRARWQFWKLSGCCTNKLIMTADASQGTVSFSLREPGFLRAYEGVWSVAPLPGPPAHEGRLLNSGGGGGADAPKKLAVVRVTTETTPARAPPPPINQALKAQARAQVESMVDGLLRAAAAADGGGDGGGGGAPGLHLPLEDLRV